MRMNKILPQTELLTLPKVRLISRLKGDGSVFRVGTNYYIKFYSRNFEELQRFKNDIKEVYGLDVKEILKESGRKLGDFVTHLFIRSKLVYEDLQKYGPYGSKVWRVPNEIMFGPVEFQREFLRIFSEDEGTILLGNKEVRIYSVNEKGLTEIQQMLEYFEIESKIQRGYGFGRNVFGVVIRGKNVLKFKEEIGFLSTIKSNKLELLIENLINN